MLKIGSERCPFCYRQDIYISTPKDLWEELAILALLQPVRCHDCMHRFFRPIFASPPSKLPAGFAAFNESKQKQEESGVDRGRAA
jgi:hypothetical protein